MQISNPEVHRETIGEVEIVPESEWILVARKVNLNLLPLYRARNQRAIVNLILRTDAGG